MQEQAQQYAIGWGTLSLINAGLAQSKGRSGLLWWLASLIFGPLATFLIVVLPSVGPIAAVRDEEGRSLSSLR
ncbi:MAG: hypothetical protein ACRELG_07140 [Gemmataceae bacterium]